MKQSPGEIRHITTTFSFIGGRIDEALNQNYTRLQEALQAIADMTTGLKAFTKDQKAIKTYTWFEQKMAALASDPGLTWDHEADLKEDEEMADKIVKNNLYSAGCPIPTPNWNLQYEQGRLCQYFQSHEIMVRMDENMLYPQYCTRMIPLMHELVHAYTRDGIPGNRGGQPFWFREGIAIFLSKEYAGIHFTDSQRNLWRIEEPYYMMDRGMPTEYAEAEDRIKRLAAYGEKNKIGRLEFVLNLAKLKGKIHNDGTTLHDEIYRGVSADKPKDEILVLMNSNE